MVETFDGDVPARGCGKRQPGGLYLCTHLSEHGAPLEAFLIDPVIELDVAPFRAPILQPLPGDTTGVLHAYVWVGAEHYPSPWDYLEETRQHGASRRVPSHFDLSALTPGKSRLILVHPKAHTATVFRPDACPKRLLGENGGHGERLPCLGAHRHYVASLRGADPADAETWAAAAIDACETGAEACVGAVRYALPHQAAAPGDLAPGAFLQLPLHGVDYVRRDADDPGPGTLGAWDAAGWRVRVCQE
jgi:hypothetical protein